MKVSIKQQRGHFNLVNPSEESTEVVVKIPECGFNERFSFKEALGYDLTDCPWDVAIETVVDMSHDYIRQKGHAKELDMILKEHRESIREEWREHRIAVIEQELDHLKGESA